LSEGLGNTERLSANIWVRFRHFRVLTLSGASRSEQKKVVCRVFKPPLQLRLSEATSGWRAAARPTD
jgi:hypothetical protein